MKHGSSSVDVIAKASIEANDPMGRPHFYLLSPSSLRLCTQSKRAAPVTAIAHRTAGNAGQTMKQKINGHEGSG
jgi:hypothetical protein